MPVGVLGKSPIDYPFLQKPTSLTETAFNLYGFANAWGATYLSRVPSYRNGFVNSVGPENCLQLDRALDNLSNIPDVTQRFETSQGDMDVDMRFTLTDRISTDQSGPDISITPCPEALYQIRLHYGKYLARAGFNVHDEDGLSVLSIVNLQGARQASESIAGFKAEFNLSPFNILVKRVLSLAANQPNSAVRGMINPAASSRLYWGVFSSENVDMYHAHRKHPANS
jgi:hypothetical protein